MASYLVSFKRGTKATKKAVSISPTVEVKNIIGEVIAVVECDEKDLAALREVEGVISVEPNRQVRLNPPGKPQ